MVVVFLLTVIPTVLSAGPHAQAANHIHFSNWDRQKAFETWPFRQEPASHVPSNDSLADPARDRRRGREEGEKEEKDSDAWKGAWGFGEPPGEPLHSRYLRPEVAQGAHAQAAPLRK